MDDYDSKLGIYSPNDFLTEKLENRFKEKYVDVLVFQEIKDIKFEKFNYLIINLTNGTSSQKISEIEKILELINNTTCKVTVLFPQYVPRIEKISSEKTLERLTDLNKNLGIILVPEVLGSSVKFNNDYVSHDIIMQSIVSERIKLKNDGRLINTINVNKLVDEIVKATFSFGLSGQRLNLVGPRRVAKTLATKYLKIKEGDLIFINGDYDFTEIKSDVSTNIDFSLRLAVKNTLNSFLTITQIKVSTEQVLIPERQVSRKTKTSIKKIIPIFSTLIFIYLLPFILVVISTFLLSASTKFIFSNTKLAEKLILGSSEISSLAGYINFNNSFYTNSASIVQKSSNLMNEGLYLSKLGTEFVSKIMGDSLYDMSFYSNSISASLDKIHTNINFLQTDIAELDGFVGTYLNRYLNSKRIDVSDLKSDIYSLKVLASRMSTLLGIDKPMKYLILFQNNMELRPTGGFIGSYAILTLDKGRLNEIVVSDIYSADGQLKGHVEPPEALKNYLGEGGWYMRDSNWDPDFPSTSLKVEWFLDKETNTEVDGVIAIDLHFVQSLLEITGPITLSDFSKVISSENLYVETQSEVEGEFFPGSIKKASFLTSLAKNLILELENMSSAKYFLVFKEINKNLEEKHIQVYSHDKNSQEALSDLNYAGEVDMNTDCGLRCFNDKYMLVDANLGVNKSNLFIRRSQQMNAIASKEYIGHELLVTYENTARIAIGQHGIYKTYTRLLLPPDSNISSLGVYSQDGSYKNLEYKEEIINGRKEVGFYIEVLPSMQTKVQIAWNINTDIFANGGEYNLLAQKQAGIDNDKLKIVLRGSGLSLTGKASPVYNTDLSRDFKLKAFFK